MKKKRRMKDLSVMLIPDDYSDPIGFKVSYTKLKVLAAISLIIFIHMMKTG